MRNALPKASYIGFTGTPLFKDDLYETALEARTNYNNIFTMHPDKRNGILSSTKTVDFSAGASGARWRTYRMKKSSILLFILLKDVIQAIKMRTRIGLVE